MLLGNCSYMFQRDTSRSLGIKDYLEPKYIRRRLIARGMLAS
jgi:hypothetical protein